MVLTPQKVAALCTLSNEVVGDSNANVLDSVGQKMVRSVALEADRAMFAGTGGKQPTGILNITPALPSHVGAVDYAGIVTAAGLSVRPAVRPTRHFVNPADMTGLQLATDANDRPLVRTTEGGMGSTIAGMTLWPTPAVPGATAVIAQADQIVVAVREDASVAVSDQFAFNADGTVVRVIARVDVGVNDPDGLCVIKRRRAGRRPSRRSRPRRVGPRMARPYAGVSGAQRIIRWQMHRVTAISLMGVTFFGATVEMASHETCAMGMTPDVGVIGGTVVYPADSGGFVVLDSRSPVDTQRPIRYHGGSIS